MPRHHSNGSPRLPPPPLAGGASAAAVEAAAGLVRRSVSMPPLDQSMAAPASVPVQGGGAPPSDRGLCSLRALSYDDVRACKLKSAQVRGAEGGGLQSNANCSCRASLANLEGHAIGFISILETSEKPVSARCAAPLPKERLRPPKMAREAPEPSRPQARELPKGTKVGGTAAAACLATWANRVSSPPLPPPGRRFLWSVPPRCWPAL